MTLVAYEMRIYDNGMPGRVDMIFHSGRQAMPMEALEVEESYRCSDTTAARLTYSRRKLPSAAFTRPLRYLGAPVAARKLVC